MEVKDSKGIIAVWNGVSFKFNDLVDVFVGTGKGVPGNKAFPIKGRFKGVRVEKGEERFLCRPIVGSQKGRCPSFPRESVLKINAFGSDVYGERKPLYFSKLKSEEKERYQQLPAPSTSFHCILNTLTPPLPTPTTPPFRLMLTANVEVMVEKKKAESSLKKVKLKAALQERNR